MSESPLPPNGESSKRETLLFMILLSIVCAVILSTLASVLTEPKEAARELDRSKQMMIAAHLLDHEGHFLLPKGTETGEDGFVRAIYEGGVLRASREATAATSQAMLTLYRSRIVPLLVDDRGQVATFTQKGIDFDTYVNEYKKTGYYREREKLVYKVLANPSSQEEAERYLTNPLTVPAIAWILPINGIGLWDAIYGYLAIQPDGNTVIGTTWYDQKETPGLGANIAEPSWQKLFPGKKIFQENPDGTTDYEKAQLGLTVIKGKVAEVFGSQPKAHSAVDGMTGATLTGSGVTAAYKDVLQAYRPFLLSLRKGNEES